MRRMVASQRAGAKHFPAANSAVRPLFLLAAATVTFFMFMFVQSSELSTHHCSDGYVRYDTKILFL